MHKIICLLLSSVCFLFCACVDLGGTGEDNRLSTPQNLRAEGKTLVWDEVENADRYLLEIRDTEYETLETSFDLGFLTEVGTYEIELVAVGSGAYKNSLSATFSYTVKEIETTFYDENGFEYALLEDESGYEISQGKASLAGEISLPDTFKGLPVKRIAYKGFFLGKNDPSMQPNPFTGYGCNNLTTGLTLPAQLESIGQSAFSCMTKLKGITLPDTVTEVGVYAFNSCISLKRATLSKNLKVLAGGCFKLCNLTELVLPESLEIIGMEAFASDKEGRVKQKFTKVAIPESVKHIGEEAFSHCEKLTEIVLPSNLDGVEIGRKVFYKTGLYNNSPNGLFCIGNLLCGYKNEMPENSEITVPETVKYIADYAFYEQKNLKSVILPDGLKDAGELVFGKCESLTKVRLPSDLTKVWASAFWNCSSLTEIEIPSSVTEIGIMAFSYCSSLTEIEIPDGVTEIKDSTFWNCSGLTKIEIPNTVTKIGTFAFEECNALKEILIPKSLQYLGCRVFWRCHALETIYYEGGETEWNNLILQENSERDKESMLKDVLVYTYSESQPLEAGNYWRYENGVPTVWDIVWEIT